MTPVTRKSAWSLSLLLLAGPFLCSSDAADLGAHGKLYPVVETDLLALIHDRLAGMEASGELAKLNAEMVNRVTRSARRPPAVPGIQRASTTRSWLVDPSIIAERDIADHRGVVFVRAGTRVNPLSYAPFTKTLIFLDGDDPEQIDWARKATATLGPTAKIILTSGDVFDAMQALSVPVYFDQGGRLTTRWGIKAVPATVRQDGEALRIREEAL